MAALDLSSLKSYVSGGAARPLSSGTVLLDVQHSLIEQRFVEIPFDVHGSLDAVKDKIHSLCGTPPSYQQLYLDGPNGTLLSAASATSSSPPPSSSLSLSSFGVRGGSGSGGGGGGSHFLYVVDTDPFALGRNGALHDVSQVKKYVMSDEEYKKRDNTYRAFKERQKQADPNWQSVYQQRAARQQHSSSSSGGKDDDGAAAESLDELRARISVGSRCVIQPADRRGTVKYVGSVPELSVAAGSVWVGVDLDEPVGKHAGTVLGKSYFEARGSKHGTFVKPANVKCGDFPEIDPFDDSDDEQPDASNGNGSAQQPQQQQQQQQQGDSSSLQSQSVQPKTQADNSALYEEL